MTINFTGYKDEGFGEILHFLENNNDKQNIVRLDYPDKAQSVSFEEIDLVLPSLKISKLEIFEPNKEKGYDDCFARFNCSESTQKALLKLIYYLKKLGDCGHSYSVKINNTNLFWDGDGSDRINKVNGKDTKNMTKTNLQYNSLDPWMVSEKSQVNECMFMNKPFIAEDFEPGQYIHIVHMDDQYSNYDGREGYIKFIDSIGQLHGTWGGCALIPGVDEFYVTEPEEV